MCPTTPKAVCVLVRKKNSSSISSIFPKKLMLHVFGAWNNAVLFQTGWFIESLLSQTLIVHVIRTDKIPFLQSRSSLPLAATTLAICALGIWLPFSPLARSFGLTVPPTPYWGLIALVILAYMCLAQIVKTYVVRRFQPGANPTV